MKSLPERFRQAFCSLADPGKKFLLAFSGGLDSTALVSLAAAWLSPENLLAAHLDHGLRPQSGREAQIAAESAQALGVRMIAGRMDILALAGERGRGLEEAARWGRRQFLEQTLAAWGGDFIVTAHQQNDLAETVLLKLLRGGGPGSLTGIQPIAGKWLRPLLEFTRSELAAYVREKDLSFTEDPSNQDPAMKRNHLRHRLWPLLLEQNPAFPAALFRASRLALAEEEFWSARTAGLDRELAQTQPGGRIGLKSQDLLSLSAAEQRRLLDRLLRRIDLPGRPAEKNIPLAAADLILKLARLPRKNGRGWDLPGGFRAETSGPFLYLGPSSRLSTRTGTENKNEPGS
ncbi:MAG: tRNA lysidine(34) synthetase TilS [Deltaproteobacteria bacterium]|jgi:tRNA(Ile)-lysidine synthase|nr:tRNA lysidine(34) synthetase TilS [Deltaproteobacteria bacterium]